MFKRIAYLPVVAALASMCAGVVAAADLPSSKPAAEAGDECQAFGPVFSPVGFVPFCVKFGYDLRFSIAKDFAGYDIALQGLRLPTVQNANPSVPALIYFLKDFRDRTFDPRPSIDAQVNMAFGAQTDFGPLTGFVNLRGAGSFIANGAPVVENTINVRGAATEVLDQAWVKLAGFTAGVYSSFFNFTQPGYSYSPGYAASTRAPLIGYSHFLTPNLVASVSLEDPTRHQTADGILSRYAASRVPDVVGQLRAGNEHFLVQAAGAYHQIRDAAASSCCGGPATTGNGWAVSLGGEYKTRWSDVFGEAAGDMYGRAMISAAYTRGALAYLGVPFFAVDYVAESNGRLHLTEGVSGLASYEHLWNPKWKTTATLSLYRMSMASTPTDLGFGNVFNFTYAVRGAGALLGTEYILQPGLMVGAEISQVWDRAQGSFAAIAGLPAQVRNTSAQVYLRATY